MTDTAHQYKLDLPMPSVDATETRERLHIESASCLSYLPPAPESIREDIKEPLEAQRVGYAADNCAKPMTLSSDERLYQRATTAYIRTLLGGGSPKDTPPEAFGPYQDIIRNLQLARNAGGTPKVWETCKNLLRRYPELAELVSGDQPRSERKRRWTADELLRAQFPPIIWVIPNLLPEGLSFLAGRPKLGKSWLALQIAQAVACGGRLFDRAVEQGSVLYLALEDSERRLQRRMQQQGWRASPDAVFYTTWDPLDAGGLASLQTEMEKEVYRLVIIDTLSRALSGKRDQNAIGDMMVGLAPLQRLALDQGAAILVIDHHTKRPGGTPDPVDDILGSIGKGAVADCVMGLYRERGKKHANLQLVGRDLEEHHILELEWDSQSGCWQFGGYATEVAKDTVQAEILAAIADFGGQATTTQIAEHLGKDKGNISREITKLLEKGQLQLGEKIGRDQFYIVPGIRQQEAAA